ncbi:Vacuolar protein sorting-associated protein 11 [Manis javanica]|nr:Vacuolar protein sorting-associated protein 11 [Manis javanica]
MERWKDAMAWPKAPWREAAQDRALTEATAFAIRIDVAEEVTRLDSHLDEIQEPAQEGRRDRQAPGFLIGNCTAKPTRWAPSPPRWS